MPTDVPYFEKTITVAVDKIITVDETVGEESEKFTVPTHYTLSKIGDSMVFLVEEQTMLHQFVFNEHEWEALQLLTNKLNTLL